MIPTRAQVISYAQMLAGDPAGAIFVDNSTPSAGQINLGLAFESAFREIWTTYDYNQIPTAIQTVWYNLPANTTQLKPATMGLTNFEELASLEERSVAATATVVGSDVLSPITLTTSSLSAAGIGSGTEVLISGVGGQLGANGRWICTVTDDTHLLLNGSISVAAWTAGGTVTTSNDYYTKINQLSELPTWVAQTQLLVYVWQNNTFYFIGATTTRELRLAYFASGTAPASGAVGIDDSLDFLAYRTAAIGSKILGNTRGPDLDAQATAYLNLHVTPLIRSMQNEPAQPRAYRTGGRRQPGLINPAGTLFS
jgi:hypothetical protein